MKPVLPGSRQWCASFGPSSHGKLMYLYYLASAPQASLNPIRLAVSSVITGWVISPWRPQVSDLLWAQGAEEGKQNQHEGLSARSVLQEGHEENPITASAPIFMLERSRGRYCHPHLLLTFSCLSKVHLQCNENAVPPLSALIFSLFYLFTHLVLLLTKMHNNTHGQATWEHWEDHSQNKMLVLYLSANQAYIEFAMSYLSYWLFHNRHQSDLVLFVGACI